MTDAPTPPSFGFFKIIVKDLDKMLAFYEQVVGIKLVNRIESDAYVELLCATPGMEKGPYVILFYNKDDREITIGNGWGPVGFWITGVDSMYKHALANGRRRTRSPMTIAVSGLPMFTIRKGMRWSSSVRPADQPRRSRSSAA